MTTDAEKLAYAIATLRAAMTAGNIGASAYLIIRHALDKLEGGNQ